MIPLEKSTGTSIIISSVLLVALHNKNPQTYQSGTGAGKGDGRKEEERGQKRGPITPPLPLVPRHRNFQPKGGGKRYARKKYGGSRRG